MATPPTPDAWAPSEFPRTLRGYSPTPVDEAIAAAVERIETLTRENRLLNARVEDLEARLSVFEQRAQATQDALITAQTAKRKTLEAAEVEADERRRAVEEEARAEADRIRGEAESQAALRRQQADREVATLAAQVERLEKRRAEFLEYVSNELGVASPVPGRKRTRRKSQPLDIRFRRPGEGPAAPSAEVQLDG